MMIASKLIVAAAVVSSLAMMYASADTPCHITAFDDYAQSCRGCGWTWNCGYDTIAAPNEATGLIGPCTCPDGTTTYSGLEMCANGQAPNCVDNNCGKQICVCSGGRCVTAYIGSECPHNHPENVQNCANNGFQQSWCPCVTSVNSQPGIDLNYVAWKQLFGNTNYGYEQGTFRTGAC
eukprot:TRINITY_DN172_c0_g1_i1.p1 TRINITY_DN172_c0_g1~~TRINITY_DN172_c0_g1_i1.p1  ORF type:complete len:178 (+),score=27.08 TRINITY_DN172_c0_g1_i1:71-604(+)